MSAHTARQLLLLLVLLPGPLFACTSLLPSSFTMYFLTAAAAYVMEGRPLRVAALGILGVLWGWPVAGGPTSRAELAHARQPAVQQREVLHVFSCQQILVLQPHASRGVLLSAGVAFLPYIGYVLWASPPAKWVSVGVMGTGLALAPVLACDRLFYGQWTVSILVQHELWCLAAAWTADRPACSAALLAGPCASDVAHAMRSVIARACVLARLASASAAGGQLSLWNFVRYNVVGGGDSALYGVEDRTYYLRNGFNNLNFAMLLALMGPALGLLQWSAPGASLHQACCPQQRPWMCCKHPMLHPPAQAVLQPCWRIPRLPSALHSMSSEWAADAWLSSTGCSPSLVHCVHLMVG